MSQCHNYINPMSLRQGVSMSWELYNSQDIEAPECLNVIETPCPMTIFIIPMSLRQGVSVSWELYKSKVIEAGCLDVMGII